MDNMKAIKLLGIEGKKVDIIPTVHGLNLTQVFSKKGNLDHMATIVYDKKWKKYVLAELKDDFQMSRDCINEAFDMTESYWGNKLPK